MGTRSRTGLETRGRPQSSIGGVDLSGTAFTAGLLYRALAVTDSREAMDLSVSLATEILPGCDAAGVCVVHSGDRIDTHAASIDALLHHDTVRSNDLSREER